MSEKAPLLPKPPGPLRVWIDTLDPLVEASLRAAFAHDGSIELADAPEREAVLVYDAGATRGATRARMAALPAQHAAVVVLIADAADVQLAASKGVEGIVLRVLDGQKLLHAVKAVQHGLTVMDGALLPPKKRALPSEAESNAPSDALTARELEVLQLVADGLSNHRIATRLGISDHTVKFHINAILEKLGADSRTEAVVTAVRRGILWL
jgi:DNA-binding NarL/FixJ family response regulator